MCGIVLVHKKEGNSASKSVWKRYNAQKARGSDGFGFVSFEEGKLKKYARFPQEAQAEAELKKCESPLTVFHHRYPTSTVNVAEAAHPIMVRSRALRFVYYVVHNGIITNADTLRKSHEARGIEYSTVIQQKWITRGNTYVSEEFNDSEALAVELALLLEDKESKVNASGDYAFVVLQTTKDGVLKGVYYGTNGGNPLTITDDKNIFSVCSQGGSKDVPAGKLFRYDPKTFAVSELPHNIGAIKYDKFGYDYDYGYSVYDHKSFNWDKNGKPYLGDKMDALDEMEEIEAEIEVLYADLRTANDEARISGDYAEVEEIKAQIIELETEKDSIALSAHIA